MRLIFAIGFLSSLLHRLSDIIPKTFGYVTKEQLAYVVFSPNQGVANFILITFSIEFLLKPTVFGLIILALAKISKKLNLHKKIVPGFAALIFFYCFAIFAYSVKLNTDLLDFNSSSNKPYIIENYYKKITTTSIDPTFNHVLIYIESWNYEYLKNIDLTEYDAKIITKIKTYRGSQWTMGSLVSTGCGFPLLPYRGLSFNNFGKESLRFLPGADCIQNLAKDNGYRLFFFGGADTSFAGKNKFLLDRGFDRIFGKNEIFSNGAYGEPEKNWWGYSDRDMLAFSLRFIEASIDDRTMSKVGNFIQILTLDTHGPDGKLWSFCQDRSEAQYVASTRADIIYACSLNSVKNFIDKLRLVLNPEKTFFYLVGDHPAMRAENARSNNFGGITVAGQNVGKETPLVVIGPPGHKFSAPRREVRPWDVAATIRDLASSGKDTTFGMGRSIFQELTAEERMVQPTNTPTSNGLYASFWREEN